MANDGYTEGFCVAQLERKGCKFGGMKTFTVPKRKLGIKFLGMVDYLQKRCGMVAKFE